MKTILCVTLSCAGEKIAFRTEERPYPTKTEKEVLVRPLYLGMNAGMRSRIGRDRDGAGTLHEGDIPTSDAVVCLESGPEKGRLFFLQWCPWAQIVAVSPEKLVPLPTDDPILYMTILGHTGFTGWVSMELAQLRHGDHVVVTGAAGGVGSSVIQWAQRKGVEVTALASTERIPLLEETFGISCVDRKKEKTLPTHTVFHDGVGGEWLGHAIDTISTHGRIMLCGNLSGAFPSNLSRMIHKDLTMRGFTVIDYAHWRQRFWKEGLEAYRAGELQLLYSLEEGWENLGQAFLEMGEKPHLGRSLVCVG